MSKFRYQNMDRKCDIYCTVPYRYCTRTVHSEETICSMNRQYRFDEGQVWWLKVGTWGRTKAIPVAIELQSRDASTDVLTKTIQQNVQQVPNTCPFCAANDTFNLLPSPVSSSILGTPILFVFTALTTAEPSQNNFHHENSCKFQAHAPPARYFSSSRERFFPLLFRR